MIVALAFVFLLLAWAALTLAARRPGWGCVGRPPTEFEVACRVLARGITAWQREIGEALLPALRRVTDAFCEFAAAMERPPT